MRNQKLKPFSRLVIAFAITIPTVISFAQEVTMADIVQGRIYKPEVKADELPADFMAMEIRQQANGGGTIFDMIFGMMGSMGAMGAGDQKPEDAEMLEFMDTYWTSGATVRVGNQSFLVGYRPDFNMAALKGAKPPKIKSLKLTLIRFDTVSTIAPRLGWDKARLAKAMDLASKGEPSAEAKFTASMSSLKQYAVATIMYLNDNDDVFPYVQGTAALRVLTTPYAKNAEVFRTSNPNGTDVIFNMALAGVSMSAIPNPAETVMLYEKFAWPDGRRLVAFADGHVKAISESELEAVWKASATGLPRTGKPLSKDFGLQEDPLLKLDKPGPATSVK